MKSEKFVSAIRWLATHRIPDWLNLIGIVATPILVYMGHYFIAIVVFVGFTPSIEEIKEYATEFKAWCQRFMIRFLMRKAELKMQGRL